MDLRVVDLVHIGVYLSLQFGGQTGNGYTPVALRLFNPAS
jgi:hypothetical protein